MALEREVTVKVKVEPTVMPAKTATGGATVASVLPPRHPSLPPLPPPSPSPFLTPPGPGEGVPRGSTAGMSSTFRGLGRMAMLGGGLLGAGGAITGPAGEMISGIGSGTMAGAAIGSAIPGIGTVAGAGIGAAAGVLTSVFSSLADQSKKVEEGFRGMATVLDLTESRRRAVASGEISTATFGGLSDEIRTRVLDAAESERPAVIESELAKARERAAEARARVGSVESVISSMGVFAGPAASMRLAARTASTEAASVVSVLEEAVRSGISGVTRPEGAGRTGFGDALSVSDMIIEGMAARSPPLVAMESTAESTAFIAGAASAILEIVSRWATPMT